MAQQHINSGSAPNDGTGDTLRVSQIKSESNFNELYSGKVNVVLGKVLSDTNYTQAEKEQLATLVAAGPSVQSDMTEGNSLSPAFIKNKFTNTSDFNNDGDGTQPFIIDTGAVGHFVRSQGQWINIPVTFDSDDILNRSTVSGATATDALNNLNTGLDSKVNGTGVAGQVPFWSGTNVLSRDSSLYWNIANKFLGVGSANPDQKLTISSNTPNLVHLENALTTSNGSHDVKIDCFKSGLGYNNLVLSAYNFKLLSAGVNEVFSVSNGGNATISSASNPSMSFSGPTASGVVGWSGSNFRMINFSGSGGVTIQANGSVDINTQGGSVITFGTSATERARITSGGNLLYKTVTDNGQGVIQANGNITASPATLPNQVVVYSQLGVQPKKYTALMSQTGTSAPTVTVLENTLGGTVVWTRSSTGTYIGTLSGAFNLSKTACIHQKSGQVLASSYTDYYLQGDSSNNFLTLRTKQSGSFTDGLLLNDTIKIEVYP